MDPTGPSVLTRFEGAQELALLLWKFPMPYRAISSAPMGGGIGLREWVINVQVPRDYKRLDPEYHLTELAAGLGLNGPGVGLLTAVDVRGLSSVLEAGLRVDATVGLTRPVWAAQPEAPIFARPGDLSAGFGTINIVAAFPEAMSDAAMVNAVGTVAEAKAQALFETGIPGTGTASDAVCILCPTGGPVHQFGGPRSEWGARLARAVHRSLTALCDPGPPQ